MEQSVLHVVYAGGLIMVCLGGLPYMDSNTLYIVQGDSQGLDPGSLIYGDVLLSEHCVVTKLIACTWWLQNNLSSNATYSNIITCNIHNSTYMTLSSALNDAFPLRLLF